MEGDSTLPTATHVWLDVSNGNPAETGQNPTTKGERNALRNSTESVTCGSPIAGSPRDIVQDLADEGS